MSDLTITAQRARELALAKHKAEIASITKQMQVWRIAGILGLSELILGLLVFLAHDPEPGWRGKQDAPPMQRVHVITTGFVDKQGQWRSFENGEPITVNLWKP
jgi:hypothetical protein